MGSGVGRAGPVCNAEATSHAQGRASEEVVSSSAGGGMGMGQQRGGWGMQTPPPSCAGAATCCPPRRPCATGARHSARGLGACGSLAARQRGKQAGWVERRRLHFVFNGNVLVAAISTQRSSGSAGAPRPMVGQVWAACDEQAQMQLEWGEQAKRMGVTAGASGTCPDGGRRRTVLQEVKGADEQSATPQSQS